MAGQSGGFVIPGTQVVSEWQSPAPGTGIIAKCVEAAEAVMTGIYGILPATPATTTRLANDQIARGEAKPSGASYIGSPSAQLTRIGLPNATYGADWINQNDWTTVLNSALTQGKPVLLGFDNAQALQDSRTGAQPDLGVHGHGATAVGIDAAGTGYLVADPNTAPGSPLMDYSPANLKAAGLSTLIVPQSAPGAVQAGGTGAAAPAANPLPGIFGGLASTVNWNQVGATAGTAAASTVWDNLSKGIQNQLGDLAIRGVLIALALLLVALALGAFFFAGSGRTLVGEGGKAAAGAAGKALFA